MVASDHAMAVAGAPPALSDLAGLSMIGFRRCIAGERTDDSLRAKG